MNIKKANKHKCPYVLKTNLISGGRMSKQVVNYVMIQFYLFTIGLTLISKLHSNIM